MTLHNDKEAFELILIRISERTGIRIDILEKDYYVTLLLHELSEKQESTPAFFKGGTALYKALGSIRRFSEDIDLTVEIRDCSNSQAKKRLKNASKKYISLKRTDNKDLEIDNKDNITAVYDYSPIISYDKADPLQRFGYVKIEATSFTISKPYENAVISPVIYEKANDKEKMILKNVYNIEPFSIKTIKIERIFADKIFAAEFYYERKSFFDVAKHIYDITVMLDQPRIKSLIESPKEFSIMLSYKREEEKYRIGSDLSNKKFLKFTIFNGLNDQELVDAYERMQKIYVFNEKDRISFDKAKNAILSLKSYLLNIDMFDGEALIQEEPNLSEKSQEFDEDDSEDIDFDFS